MSTSVALVGIFVCLVAEAFFSASEIALVALDKLHLRRLAQRGERQVEILQRLLQKPELLFGTTLLGTNVSMVLGSSLATQWVESRFGSDSRFLAVVGMTPLVLILAELLPKTIAQARADDMALRVAAPLAVVQKVLLPVTFFLARISQVATSLLGRSKQLRRSPLLTREDLEYAIQLAGHRGGLKALERQMIGRILEFRDTVVGEVMIPLSEVVAVPAQSTPGKVVEVIQKYGLSRVPLFTDRIDHVVGVVEAADLLPYLQGGLQSLTAIQKPALFVPTAKPLREMLLQFQQEAVNMAVVVDEFGGMVGIVTVEDILEEVVGEIEDEYDSKRKQYRKVGEHSYQVDGQMSIAAIRQLLQVDLPEGEYTTIAGFILQRFKRIPKVGDVTVVGDWEIRILRASERAVALLQLQRRPS